MSSAPAGFNAACHPACIACRPESAGGLGLRFGPDGHDGVVAEFACAAAYQGYPDRVHGGVIATLLDAAMTHCLFAREIRGYTAKLNVRFHRPVEVGVPATVHARLTDARPPLYLLRGELRQGGVLRASARASFWGEELL